MSWYIAVLKKYAVFTGRSRRKEFWMFFLFQMIFVFVLVYIDELNSMSRGNPPVLTIIYVLATLLPNLGVQVRRLHDIGHTGWLILIGLIPYIGVLIMLILYMIDSEPGENKYGPNPKGVLKKDEKVVT